MVMINYKSRDNWDAPLSTLFLSLRTIIWRTIWLEMLVSGLLQVSRDGMEVQVELTYIRIHVFVQADIVSLHLCISVKLNVLASWYYMGLLVHGPFNLLMLHTCVLSLVFLYHESCLLGLRWWCTHVCYKSKGLSIGNCSSQWWTSLKIFLLSAAAKGVCWNLVDVYLFSSQTNHKRKWKQ
jgi:hypothetical protein